VAVVRLAEGETLPPAIRKVIHMNVGVRRARMRDGDRRSFAQRIETRPGAETGVIDRTCGIAVSVEPDQPGGQDGRARLIHEGAAL
jgi:hypothetical protein